MATGSQIIKKIFKVFAWVIGVFLFLVIALIIIIRIPSVQNYVAGKVTAYVEKETGTEVNVGNIYIGFPSTVILKEIFLDDLKGDTLLYAKEISADLELIGLIKGKLRFGDIDIETMTANISRNKADSLFNFDFLVKAFAPVDTTAVVDTTKKPLDLTVDVIHLSNIKFSFRDDITGMDIHSAVGILHLPVKEMNVDSLIFHMGAIEIENSHVNFVQNLNTPADSSGSPMMPFLSLESLHLGNSTFKMVNANDSTGIDLKSGDFDLADAEINMKQNNFSIEKIQMSNTAFKMYNRKEIRSTQSGPTADPDAIFQLPYSVSVRNTDIVNSVFVMQAGDTAVTSTFNPSNINLALSRISLDDVVYNNGKAAIKIHEARIADHSGVEVKHLEGELQADSTSVSIDRLHLVTMNSQVAGTLNARFENLKMVVNDPGKTLLNADLRNTEISISDLITFNDQLLKNEIIRKNRNRKLRFDLIAKGSLDNITITDLSASTNNSTFVNLTGIITGLPDPEKLYINLDANSLITTAADINSMLIIPPTVRLPEKMAMTANFNGTPSTFKYRLFAGTSRGTVAAKGSVIDLNSSMPGYKVDASLKNMDLGYIMKNDSMFGLTDVKLTVDGRGIKPETMLAEFEVYAARVTLNKYAYQKIGFKGSVEGGVLTVDGKVKDTNLDVDLDATAGLTPDKEFYKANIKMNGVDLKALGFSDKELRASGTGVVDLTGYKFSTLKGTAGVKDVLIIKNGKNYSIETFAFASINEDNNKSVKVESTLLSANFDGNITVDQTVKHLGNYFKRYFSSESDTVPTKEEQNFDFDIVVHNAPVISEVFVPGLESFIPGTINGSFNSAQSRLDVNIEMPQVIYNGIRVDSLLVKVDSDTGNLNLRMGLSRLSIGDVELERTEFLAVASQNVITTQLKISSDEKTKLGLSALIAHGTDAGFYKISIAQGGIILNDEKWTVPPDNYMLVGSAFPVFHNFSLKHNEEMISLGAPSSSTEKGIGINIQKLDIGVISKIIERDTSYLDGMLNGNLDLIAQEKGTGIIADMNLDKFSFRGTPVGDFDLNAKSEGNSRYSVDMKMTGQGNNMHVTGFYVADTVGGKVSGDIAIDKLVLKSVEPFTYGQLSRTSGYISGNFKVGGTMKVPEINGEVNFKDAGFNVTYLNNYFKLSDETIEVDDEGIYFDSFTIIDTLDHTAMLDGEIAIEDLANPTFSLDLQTDRFLAMNTQPENNELYFGKLLISSRVKIRGDKNLPVVTANVKLLDESEFTFIVPEAQTTTERGEKDIRFTDPYNRINPILKKDLASDTIKAEITGFDISSNIEVTKESVLRIVVDQESGDSLVIKGDATMSFSIDPSGKTSLTGGFEISEGSYRVSVQNLVKRNFIIQKGSTINWRGDMTDAEINIDAVNEVNAAPLELVADQVAGLSERDLNLYRQRLPFQVILHMDGELMAPDISFEISLPPEDQGVLNGTVYAKLNLLNQDPSELNKQVFALLVLNRFVQENPFNNESGGAVAYVARNSVSKFLSQQLNTFAEQFIKGVELNFDVQSYEDYSTGEVEGRTEVNIGISKRFYHDRLVVQVSGNVDVEGERSKQNNMSDLAGDIVLEYKLTEDGRYRLRVFRKDRYAGILDGEVKETGIGVLYTHDFDHWNQLFRKPEPEETLAPL